MTSQRSLPAVTVDRYNTSRTQTHSPPSRRARSTMTVTSVNTHTHTSISNKFYVPVLHAVCVFTGLMCACSPGYSVTVGDFNNDGQDGENRQRHRPLYDEVTTQMIFMLEEENVCGGDSDLLWVFLMLCCSVDSDTHTASLQLCSSVAAHIHKHVRVINTSVTSTDYVTGVPRGEKALGYVSVDEGNAVQTL